MGLGAVAGGVAVAGIGGALISSGAMSDAADSQSQSANAAIDEQRRQQAQTRADLLPYNTTGQAATKALSTLTGLDAGGDPMTAPLTKPITMDQATLEQTPGYQFNLTQGLKAVQNSAAARGLGVSGAALKGAATYATGLADSTYQNQFNNAVTNQTNTYNRLQGLATLGESAGAQTGALGTQTASNIGNALIGSGNAQAAAGIGGANAISAGLSGGANSISQGLLLNRLLGGGAQTGIFGAAGAANDAAGGVALTGFA